MRRSLARLRPFKRQGARPAGPAVSGVDCSWEQLRAVYQEQAARGIPEAVRGLELIEEGRWPGSGRPRRP